MASPVTPITNTRGPFATKQSGLHPGKLDGEQMLREIVDHVNVGVVIIGGDLKVRLWNRWMENVSGVDSYRACMLSLTDLMPSLRLSGLEEKIHDALHLERQSKCRLQGESQLAWAADLEVTIQPLATHYHLHSMTPRTDSMDRRCLIQFRNVGGAVRTMRPKGGSVMPDTDTPLHAGPDRAMLPGKDDGNHLHRHRILLADDNPITRGMIRKVLQAEGYEMHEVANGHEAVHIVQLANCFDLVLMDVCMPLMNGLEATSQIRALIGPKGEVPIIALAAKAGTMDREKFRNGGIDDFLVKPIHTSALVEKCRMHLEARSTNPLNERDISNV